MTNPVPSDPSPVPPAGLPVFLSVLPRGGVPGKRLALRVRAKAVSAVRQGHPWLFEDSIEKVSGEVRSAGTVAVLFDSRQKVLGAGLYAPEEQVRVKVLASGAGMPPVGSALFDLLADRAFELRNGKLPSNTNAWRMIHGESDGFPGLVADRYDTALVLKIYSVCWLPWIGDIVAALFRTAPELNRLSLRFSREVQNRKELSAFHLADGMLFSADPDWDGRVRFQENGIRFEADVKAGQKTGFFLDQRDNRDRVGSMSMGRNVLNVFSYSGGFSLYAARGGAVRVVSVDFNKHAIADCGRHFQMNSKNENISRCVHSGIADDAFHAMEEMHRRRESFELVIVDPPSFAKSSAENQTALHSYSRLAKCAVRLLAPGGVLVFASCSSRVTADELFEVVLNTARAVGVNLKEMNRTSHAVDHPARFKESSYLKCLYAKRI